MHPPEVRAQALALVEAGLNDCQISRRLGIPRPCEYLSYLFTNMSKDIIDLFVAACDRAGLFTRSTVDSRGLWRVRINRRSSVARMVEHVGLKT
jgi:hypothetical protein